MRRPGLPIARPCTVAACSVLAAAGLALGGCSSAAESADGGAAPDTGVVGCTAGSSSAQTYSPKMAQHGMTGKYTFTLEAASPAPPALLTNEWTVKIVDGQGKSASPGDITVKPWMPLMNHGTDQTPQLKANADGTFTVADIYLFMPGLWAVTFDVTSGTAPVDSAAFTFCIE